MRTRGVAPALLTLLLPAITSTAGISVTLPLRWLDRQAYVANVTLNGAPALFQVGTFNQDTWVACGHVGDRDCSTTGGTGGGSMAVENGFLSFDFLNRQTLALQDEASGTTVQYRNLTGMLRAMYNATVAPTLPLVSNDTVGVLGLSPPSPLLCGSELQADGVYACGNFSVFLSAKPDGAGSFLKLNGGSSDASLLSSTSGATTQYSMAVRATDEQGWRNKRWYLSLIGVRFGDNKVLYPRVYSYLETPGADAKGLVSLNHATLQMPPAVHARFMTAYLSACTGSKSYAMGWYYVCGVAVMNGLPRISLYAGDKVFYLDPADYTQVSSTDATKRVVLIASSAQDDTWVLGAPFLRKFPLTFSPTADTIETFCTADSSCNVQSGPLVREPVNPTDGSIDGSSGSGGGVFVPPTWQPPYDNRQTQPGFTAWDLWIAKIVGCLAVLALMMRCLRICRLKKKVARRREAGMNDTGTIASERDLEENKEELRRMEAEEETTPTAIPATPSAIPVTPQSGDFAPLHSPREAIPVVFIRQPSA